MTKTLRAGSRSVVQIAERYHQHDDSKDMFAPVVLTLTNEHMPESTHIIAGLLLRKPTSYFCN